MQNAGRIKDACPWCLVTGELYAVCSTSLGLESLLHVLYINDLNLKMAATIKKFARDLKK